MYRYIRSFECLPAILQGAIKFTPVHALNDPSELTPRFNSERIRASLERLRTSGYAEEDLSILRQQAALLDRLSPETRALPAPSGVDEASRWLESPVYDDLAFLESQLRKTVTMIAERVGVACFSTRWNSLPMWAHYAGNATGFVVQYKELDKAFPGDETGALGTILDVSYSDNDDGVTFHPGSHLKVFVCKAEDWRYEGERRVVLPLNQCSERDGVFVSNVDARHVERIILGWRASDEVADSARSTALAMNADVEVVRAQFAGGKVEVLS